MRNLLLGNGLNLTNYEVNSFITVQSTFERFCTYLKEYSEIIKALFLIDDFNYEEVKTKCCESFVGIEQVTGIVFTYVHDKIESKRKYTRNDSYRLVEILGEIAIKSIFFVDGKLCVPIITEDYIRTINEKYDNVFSLNYIEGWDKLNKVTYLHGNISRYINSYCDIGSAVLSFNGIYRIWKKGEYTKVDFRDIVFMPTNEYIDKEYYVINGIYPGDDLFPADDLFPYGGRDIYKSLDNIDNVDIFGMSPYGDRNIIDKIKNIVNKRIFVYQMNENEINEWRRNGIDNCFVDSADFLAQ